MFKCNKNKEIGKSRKQQSFETHFRTKEGWRKRKEEVYIKVNKLHCLKRDTIL